MEVRRTGRRLLAAVVAMLALLAVAAQAQAPTPPPNDNRDSATVVRRLPSSFSGTTVAATVEPNEPFSGCGVGPTANSVWYSMTTPAAARIAVRVAAAGKLDVAVDVYLEQRSQLTGVACDQTDPQGKAALTFRSTKDATYLIRVAQLARSVAGTFSLDVFQPQPPVAPPGTPLPSAGVTQQVDRIQNVSQAWAVTLKPGTSYRVNLHNETEGGCASFALFAPGARDFESAKPVLSARCGGYRLFTPGAGKGGRYSILVTPSTSLRDIQAYHLQLAPAGPASTSPGLPLLNHARAQGTLNDRGIDVVRLYRFDVTSRSSLELSLDVPDSAQFDLRLLNDHGHTIACACGESGAQDINRNLSPGRYFAAVIATAGTAGHFTLSRESRTITHTSISINGRGVGIAAPGVPVAIEVAVKPNAAGPVSVTVERFDPLAGWQFFRQFSLQAAGGSTRASFLPPAVGRWRASAAFRGTRSASPSSSGFASVLVAGPLRE